MENPQSQVNQEHLKLLNIHSGMLKDLFKIVRENKREIIKLQEKEEKETKMGRLYLGKKLVELSPSEVQELMDKVVENMTIETMIDFLRNEGYE